MNSCRYMPALAAAAALAAGCAQQNVGTAPPKAGFYFPTSVAAVESSTPGKPFLYVVSSNFDLRYNRGSVVAVDTSKLAEPPNGALDQAVDQEKGFAYIDSFGGQIATYVPAAPAADERLRLLIPTRSDNRLYALKANDAQLSCRTAPEGDEPQDCLDQAIALEDPADPAKRTFDPFGVAVFGSTVYITHLHITDDPPLSGQNRVSYLASLDAETLGNLRFRDIGLAPAQGMAMTPNGLYFTGRALGGDDQVNSQALRFIPPACLGQDESANCVQDVELTSKIMVYEARAVALASDGARLFATTRSPDGLLVVDISLDPVSGLPRNQVIDFKFVKPGPSELLVIPRPGRRDLVAVSCTNANAVDLYDDELGAVVGEVLGIQEPFGMARSSIAGNPAGQRLYVASFGNHTVDVVDILDVNRPRTAVLVGQLGSGAHRPLGIDLPEGAK